MKKIETLQDLEDRELVQNGRQLFEKEMSKKKDSLKKIMKVKMKPIVRKTPASMKKKKMSLRSEAMKGRDEGRLRDEKDLTDLTEKDHRRQCSTSSSKIIGKNLKKMFENWQDKVGDNSTVIEGASPTPANGLFMGAKQFELGLLTRRKSLEKKASKYDTIGSRWEPSPATGQARQGGGEGHPSTDQGVGKDLERCDWSTPGHYNFTRPSQALGGGGGLQHRPGGGIRRGIKGLKGPSRMGSIGIDLLDD